MPLTSRLAALALLICAAPMEAQQPELSGALGAWDRGPGPAEAVDRIMAAHAGERPGGVVAVVRNGEIIFARGYGMANLEYAIPNAPNTVYHVASVSKQFTAFAVVMLAAQGKLSLDDDVRRHVPELHDFGHTITLRHLMTHTSGLRDQWNLWVLSGGLMDDVIRQSDLMALLRRQRELNFAPGAEYLYSNSGYLLLAETVSRVTGTPFGEWMRENVFVPLGMNSTQIYDDHERMVPGRAYSYAEGAGGVRKSVLAYANSGATSLFTTAEDLGRWLHNFRTAQVGGPAVIATMQERGVLAAGDTIPYALGINVTTWRGLRRIEHGGADAGFRANLAYFPELDAGVIVLGNLSSFNAGSVASEVAIAFFGEHMSTDRERPPPAVRSERVTSRPWSPSSRELAGLVGRYYSPELETFYGLELREGRLVMTHRRHGEIPLAPAERDRFRAAAWFLGDVRIERDPSGAVTGLRLTSGRVRDLLLERVGR